MDFGGSSDNNNNNNKNSLLSSAFDLNPNPKFYGFKPEISLSATAHNHQENYKNMLSFSSPNTPTLPYYALNNTGGYGGGPFTPSQWMELEHQALIYKYMTLNAPIPSNLLIPIKKSLQTAAYYPGINLTNTIWCGFQLGFSNSSDPEPGRCRRTDGKKWRCSRDAVADKKYCERHMNRGRHRSRKPVEGQIGHSVSNGTTTITAAGKVSDSAAVGTTVVSRLHQQNQHRLTSKTQPDTIAIANDNRSFSIKGTMAPSSVSLKQTPPSDFGFVSSLQKNENENQKLQNSLRQFMDDWPHSDKTNLSISIPMASQDFMSTNSSPISETHNFSPLRMGLGMDNTANVFDQRSHQSSWIPVSWDRSMGGPLGEALHHGTNNSGLNLMTDGWESSRQTNLSPTGVLQKTGFGCYSNSSTGSSPRTDNGPHGSTVIGSSWPLL